MTKKKTKKKSSKKKYAGTELGQEYVEANDANLFLDRPFMALSNLSHKKKGKEVPVNVQISDYLKSMKLLERSLENIERTIEKSSTILNSRIINESTIVKCKIKGKLYKTTKRMIEAVRAYDSGKIGRDDLNLEASWAEDPSFAIEIARIIGNKNEI